MGLGSAPGNAIPAQEDFFLASKEKRKLLMLGFAEDDRRLLPSGVEEQFAVRYLSIFDTFSQSELHQSDLILINSDSRDDFAARIAAIQSQGSHLLPVITVGDQPPHEDVCKDLQPICHAREQMTLEYLTGAADSAASRSFLIDSLNDERNRLTLLNGLSGILLKISRREQIAHSLSTTLVELLDTSMIVICIPELPNPLVYFHARVGLPRRALHVLKEHLEESWRVLKPEFDGNWDWVLDLKVSESSTPGSSITKSSFVTAPITARNRFAGFFCVLPRRGRRADEDYLRTFFVVADLINVLMQNLELREELEIKATYDGLTELLNRQKLMEELERECRRSRRYSQAVSIVMIDIDHFKNVNDTYGHQTGDSVLQEVSKLLRQSLREFDIAGRAGGEEFIVILPHTDAEGAALWARRYLRLLSARKLKCRNHEIAITASCGIASSSGRTSWADRLIAAADSALYDAKRSGRNRISISEPLTEREAPAYQLVDEEID